MTRLTRKLSRVKQLCLFFCAAIISFKIHSYSGYLQLGMFNSKANAQKLIAQLEAHVPQAMVIKRVSLRNKIYYRVIAEGFKSRQAALSLQSSLKKQGYQCLLRQLGKDHKLFRFLPNPAIQEAVVSTAYKELNEAIQNPEVLLNKDLHMPTAPDIKIRKHFQLSLREAILLALRYSSDIQNAELDRITQRYSLREKQNEFELIYSLEGSSNFNWSISDGVPQTPKNPSQDWSLTPKVTKKNAFGGTSSVAMNNNYDTSNYSPQIVLGYSQPLLRGAGPAVVERDLNNQLDTEIVNKLSLKQAYCDKVTAVITAYRQLVSNKNTLEIQKQSLKEAEYTLWVNKKRIEAGQLEPTGNTQQQYQVANLTVNVETQRNTLAQSRRSLLQLIGLDPMMDIDVPSDVQVGKMHIPDEKQTINYALSHNTAYLNKLIQYRITKRALVAAKNQQLWQLDLEASKTYGAASATGIDRGFKNIINGRNQASQIGLRLNVPINDIPRRSTLISAKITLEEARLSLLASKRQLITNITNQIIGINTQVNLYRMSVRQLSLAQRSYELELKKQKAGYASSLDVTNTQNQLISAKQSVITSKISYLDGISALQQELGTTLDVWKIKMRFA